MSSGYDRADAPDARREEERLLVFAAAELARRHRAAGLRLNQPEAVALICDAMLEAARAGATFAEIEAVGRAAIRPDEVMDGVASLVDEVRLEVLLDEGTRLVVCATRSRSPGARWRPGAIVAGAVEPPPPEQRDVIELAVTTGPAGGSASRRTTRSTG